MIDWMPLASSTSVASSALKSAFWSGVSVGP
jgi:hypothetical protein